MDHPHFLDAGNFNMEHIGKPAHFNRFILEDCPDQFVDCHRPMPPVTEIPPSGTAHPQENPDPRFPGLIWKLQFYLTRHALQSPLPGEGRANAVSLIRLCSCMCSLFFLYRDFYGSKLSLFPLILFQDGYFRRSCFFGGNHPFFADRSYLWLVRYVRIRRAFLLV